MVLLIFIFGVLLALGLFFIMADLLKLPIKLAPHIHMDEYKRGRLKNTLAAAGLGMTPEEYTAFAMVKTGAVLLAVIPCLLVFPLLALVVVLWRWRFISRRSAVRRKNSLSRGMRSRRNCPGSWPPSPKSWAPAGMF